MVNKKETLNDEEMIFIASLRGHNVKSYNKRKGTNKYRPRITSGEKKLLDNFRSMSEHITELKIDKSKFPKILIFDIETSPMSAYIWGRWKQNVSLDQAISEWFMLSWSAKWLNNPNVMSDVLTPEEALKENDSRITHSMWQLFNEADIVIAHNGQKFDTPRLNSRFILNGLIPPTPYRQIDTLVIARKEFGFSSNKLDALAGYFGIEHKIDTDFNLWKRCLAGEQEALDYMEAYNIKDVEILEKVYLNLRPWIKNHPNISLYLENEDETCPHCGSMNVADTGTYSYTNVSKFSNVRCMDCGGLARRRTSDYPKEKRKSLVVSV